MIDMMPPQGLLATGVLGGAQVLGPYPFVLAGNGFVGGANRPYGALVQFYDGVAVQGYTNAGADSNAIFAVGTNDGQLYFEVANGGVVSVQNHGSLTFPASANTNGFLYVANPSGTTQLGVGSNTVAGVSNTVFGVAQAGVAWLLALDASGDLGLNGYLKAAQGNFNPPAGSSGGDLGQLAALIIGGNFGGATTSQSNVPMIGWNYTNGGGEVDIIANTPGGGGALNIYKLTGSAAPYTPHLAVAINTEAMSVGVGAVPNNSTGLIYSTVVQGEYFQFDSTTGVTFDLPYPRPSPLPSGWGYTVQVTQQFSGGTMYFVSAKSSNSSITAYDSTTNTLYGWMVDIWQMQ